MMNRRLIAIILLIASVLLTVAIIPKLQALRFPGNHQGFEPVQPIAYSHRLHAGELQIPCLYCHSAAEKGPRAGIPAASSCMNCHRFITAPRSAIRAEEELAKTENREPRRIVSPEIQKLYDALALGADLKPDPNGTPKPIEWTLIHRLPDFSFFDHRSHVIAGVECQKCHGPIETMERVRQAETLSMGWCVNCHRGRDGSVVAGHPVNASTDCAACHY